MERIFQSQGQLVHTILEAVADGVTAQDPSGRFIYANDAAARMLGFPSAQALLSTPPAEVVNRFVFMDEMGQPLPVERLPGRLALQGHPNPEMVVRYRTVASGEERWAMARSRPVYNERGEIAFAVNMLHDVTAIKEAEKAIRRSERELRDFVNNAIIGLQWINADGRVLWANQAQLDLLGYAPEEYIGHPIDVFFVDAKVADDMLRRLRGGEAVPSYVVRLRCKDSTIKHVLVDANVLCENGEFVHARCFMRDVTERTQAIQALDNNRRRLQALFDNIEEAILIADDSTRYIDANPAAVALTGYPYEELMGLALADLTPATEAAQAEAAWADFIATGYQSGEFNLLRKDGTTITTEYRAVANFVPGLHLSVLQDVTRRKAARAALTRERNLLRLLIDHLPDFVYVKDRDSRFLMDNLSHAQLMHGGSTEATVGKTDFDFFPRELAQAYYEDEQAVIRTGQPLIDHEETTVGRDGKVRIVSTTKLPLRDEDGSIIGILGVTRDVTEQKALEREREAILRREQAARAAAETANALKLRFLGMVSHELRTPLASIKGFATTLLADDVTFSAEDQRQFITIINEEADKLSDLVEQLLEVTQLQAGTLRIDPAPIPVGTIIDLARTSLDRLARHHRLDLDIPADLPAVKADARRVAQVLVNLVDNAAKYSPIGRRIDVTARGDGAFVRIDVADEGDGIPASEHEAVFEAFRQGTRLHGRQRGAGLGLAICKGLINAHGGQIWIDGARTVGTRISFTLPVAEDGT